MLNLTVLSKRQMCLSSARSRHLSVDGDCVSQVRYICGVITMMDLSHTIRPHGQSPLPEKIHSRLVCLLHHGGFAAIKG
jgi:hypothetical protein